MANISGKTTGIRGSKDLPEFGNKMVRQKGGVEYYAQQRECRRDRPAVCSCLWRHRDAPRMVIRLFRLRADLRKHHYFLVLITIVLHSRMFICFPPIGIAPPIDSDFYLTAAVPALSKIKELLAVHVGT